jgi:hypothetical protein
MMTTHSNLAPRASNSALWLIVLLKPDGSTTYIDRIFTDIEEALDEAGFEAEPEDQIKLVQVCLDSETPARWAEDAARRVEALLDGNEHEDAMALAKQVLDLLGDYQPGSVSELPKADTSIQRSEPR